MKNPIPRKKIEEIYHFKYPTNKKVELTKDFPERDQNLFEIIHKRTSKKDFKKHLNLNRISELLWYTSKTIDIKTFDNGKMIWTHRPAPSAGGLHPIDLIVSLPNKKLNRFFSLYNPIEHCLYTLDLNKNLVKNFFEHIDDIINIQNSFIIWFVVHPQRTKVKYKNAGSLIWRDAGAYIYCIQLVCTALDLNSCPVGSLGVPFVNKLFGEDTVGAGGILIG